jgi:nucleoside-diphosphate kinase
VVQVLEGENAVAKLPRESWAPPTRPRPTPAPSASSTRSPIGENSVHGSDSVENAGIEIAQFFTEADIVG